MFENHFLPEIINIANAPLHEAEADVNTQSYVYECIIPIVKIFFERILKHAPGVILVSLTNIFSTEFIFWFDSS